MFSFHILSSIIIISLFFFSSDMIYAANPQTLRNAYQIESNGQTKSYHLNDYGKKMVKKMLGQYEKQIAQKGPDIIPLLITTTQNKLQGAQKTNSLGNMIIYTAVLYDLSQQNTSKGNDTIKEIKVMSSESPTKKVVKSTTSKEPSSGSMNNVTFAVPQLMKNNFSVEKNMMFFNANMELLAKYIPGRETLITYRAGNSEIVPSDISDSIFSFQKDDLFSIHFCIKATTLLDHPGWIKERNDMFNKVNKNDSNPWIGIDINSSNKAFDEFIKNLCGNESYYREIGSFVDEVTVTKTYKEHFNQNFIIALKILNLTKDTFGKSWGSGWKYDIDTLNVAIDKSIKTGVDSGNYKDYKRGMDIESDLAQFVQNVGLETIYRVGPVKPDKKYFVHIPIEMLGKQAIEFDKKNNVYRFYGNETDEIIKGTMKQRNILWGKEGRDSIYGGDMDDIIVVVGDMSTGPSKEDTKQSFEFLGLSMFNFSGMNFNKNGSPKIIDGGAGKDVLFVVGDIDLSQTKMTGIEDIITY